VLLMGAVLVDLPRGQVRDRVVRHGWVAVARRVPPASISADVAGPRSRFAVAVRPCIGRTGQRISLLVLNGSGSRPSGHTRPTHHHQDRCSSRQQPVEGPRPAAIGRLGRIATLAAISRRTGVAYPSLRFGPLPAAIGGPSCCTSGATPVVLHERGLMPRLQASPGCHRRSVVLHELGVRRAARAARLSCCTNEV
jgi:hypothetical protein